MFLILFQGEDRSTFFKKGKPSGLNVFERLRCLERKEDSTELIISSDYFCRMNVYLFKEGGGAPMK